jgi:adenine-specific DNA-methyltransferase
MPDRAVIPLSSTLSKRVVHTRPFGKPAEGKIAVKVINDYGDESLRVFEM